MSKPHDASSDNESRPPLNSLIRRGARLAYAAIAGAVVLMLTAAFASPPIKLNFVTHAAFFSQEAHQSPAFDPQVFIQDAAAKAGTGPQNIYHVDGYRNARLTDSAESRIYTAQGKLLDGFTLGSWLGAKGDVRISPSKSGRVKIVVKFRRLRRKGVYSLFENHFDQRPVGFTPLDGNGTRNSFVPQANGEAVFKVTSPEMLTHDHAVLLVYRSDGKTHGMERGEIGVTAHHQLIVRIPQ